MNGKLPAIDYQKKWIWAAVGYLVFCLLYTLTGNLHFRTPRMLTPSPVDDLLPLTAWTIWIYHSQFVFLLFTIYLIKRAKNLQHTFYSLVIACLLSFSIFLIYPTTIARAVQTNDGLTAKAFAFLYLIDSAANCFPSLHVSLAALLAAGVLRERKNLSGLVIGWALLIILSTMTTKQHYFIDVIGGLAIASMARLMVSKFA